MKIKPPQLREQEKAYLKEKRRKKVETEDKFYKFTEEHPELCPAVGSSLVYVNEYGVKIRSMVEVVANGLPGTRDELLPLSEQPEYLRSPELLAVHTKGIRFSGHSGSM